MPLHINLRSRKDFVIIDGNIRISWKEKSGKQIKLIIDAPREIKINREIEGQKSTRRDKSEISEK